MNWLKESVFLDPSQRGTALERLGAREEDVFGFRIRRLDLLVYQHFRNAHVLWLPDRLVFTGLRPGRGRNLLASMH